MLNVLICGINGKMGEAVYNSCKAQGINVVCGIDKYLKLGYDCPCYKSFDEVKEDVDTVIDFSHPSALPKIIDFACASGAKIVSGTTGYGQKEMELIRKFSRKIGFFYSENMSVGLHAFIEGCVDTFKCLKAPQIDIIEKHHFSKADVPSGTALLIGRALTGAAKEKYKLVTSNGKRLSKNDIVIHSLRSGSSVGEHTVVFSLDGDAITMTHRAESRSIFSDGAIEAARFILSKNHGLFSFKDMLLSR